MSSQASEHQEGVGGWGSGPTPRVSLPYPRPPPISQPAGAPPQHPLLPCLPVPPTLPPGILTYLSDLTWSCLSAPAGAMTQQPQEGFDRSVEDARQWMRAVQERLQINDNTQGPRTALEARLRETEVCGGRGLDNPAALALSIHLRPRVTPQLLHGRSGQTSVSQTLLSWSLWGLSAGSQPGGGRDISDMLLPWVLGSRFHCKAPEATLWLAHPARRPHAARWSLPLAGAGSAFHPTFASLCLRSLPRLFSGWSPALPTTWHEAETGKARVEGRGQAWSGEELAAKSPSLVSLGLCHHYHCHRSSLIKWVPLPGQWEKGSDVHSAAIKCSSLCCPLSSSVSQKP